MWNLTVCGIDFYHLMNWLIIYSFFGWVWETCYVSVKSGKFVNRGFINGPLCTIYGFGAVSVYMILRPFSDNLLYLYLGGVVVATALEYVTAVLMESIFHTSWWDYSDNKFNFQGRICLGASLGWGAFTVILFKVLHPFVESIVILYPVYVGEIGICVIGVGYVVDFAFSAAAAFRIHEKLPVIEAAMEQAKGEMLVKMHEKIASVGFAKEATLESVKERLGDVEVLKEMEQKRAAITAEISAELQKRKEAMAAKVGHNMQRFVKAYPNLNRGYKLRNLKNLRNKKEK
ncbi:putative ABC transporter permease [Blautia sp. HCP3S3_C12]|uniref:putative ABC transporter permease n=1 Tax=unclassified Blautia TaxID=2648079 RepID=UPI003F8B27F5